MYDYARTYYPRQQRWAIRYRLPDGTEKTHTSTSEERKAQALASIKAKGFQLISCRKLYPFNTERNQHNFDLIHNICANAMHDMDTGETPYNAAEYDRLAETKEKAERLFCLPLPVAWVPWEVLKDAKELATAAINHRQDACIAAGRHDLVRYC